jgi:hypothetical protein
MWTLFVFNPSVIYEAHADANPDGTTPTGRRRKFCPRYRASAGRICCRMAPDGTVWTTTTNNPAQQNFSSASIS